MRDALSAYLDENGFSFDAYDEKWTEASIFGVKIRVPNTRAHRWAIMLHDLHHVATGYGTDQVGEGEISAWEARDASKSGVYVASIVWMGTLGGFVLGPRRALRAWRAGKEQRRLFGRVVAQAEYDALLAGTVGSLRARLGVPREGLADRPRALHAYAPQPA
ncbi:MAG TPA: hypothetical protein VIF62_38855 [Labilithrix sp.]